MAKFFLQANSVARCVKQLRNGSSHLCPESIQIVTPNQKSLKRLRSVLDTHLDIGFFTTAQALGNQRTFSQYAIETLNEINSYSSALYKPVHRVRMVRSRREEYRFLQKHLYELGFRKYGPWAFRKSELEFCKDILKFQRELQRLCVTPEILQNYARTVDNELMHELALVYANFTNIQLEEGVLTPELCVLQLLLRSTEDGAKLPKPGAFERWITPDIHELSVAQANLLIQVVRALAPRNQKDETFMFTAEIDFLSQLNGEISVNNMHSRTELVLHIIHALQPISKCLTLQPLHGIDPKVEQIRCPVHEEEVRLREQTHHSLHKETKKEIRAVECDSASSEIQSTIRWFVEECRSSRIVLAVPNYGIIFERTRSELLNLSNVIAQQDESLSLSIAHRWDIDFLANPMPQLMISMLDYCITYLEPKPEAINNCKWTRRYEIEKNEIRTEALYKIVSSQILPSKYRLNIEEKDSLDSILSQASELDISFELVLNELIDSVKVTDLGSQTKPFLIKKLSYTIDILSELQLFLGTIYADEMGNDASDPKSVIDRLCLECFIKFRFGSTSVSSTDPTSVLECERKDIVKEFLHFVYQVCADLRSRGENVSLSSILGSINDANSSTSVNVSERINRPDIDPAIVELATYKEILENGNDFHKESALALIGVCDSIFPGNFTYFSPSQFVIPEDVISLANKYWGISLGYSVRAPFQDSRDEELEKKVILQQVIKKFSQQREISFSYARHGYYHRWGNRTEENLELPCRYVSNLFQDHKKASSSERDYRLLPKERNLGNDVSPMLFVKSQVPKVVRSLSQNDERKLGKSNIPQVSEESIFTFETCPKKYMFKYVYKIPVRSHVPTLQDLSDSVIVQTARSISESAILANESSKDDTTFWETASRAWNQTFQKENQFSQYFSTEDELKIKQSLDPMFDLIAMKMKTNPVYMPATTLSRNAWFNQFSVLHGFKSKYAAGAACRVFGSVHHLEQSDRGMPVTAVKYTVRSLDTPGFSENVENNLELVLGAWAMAVSGENRVKVKHIAIESLSSQDRLTVDACPETIKNGLSRIENSVRKIVRGQFPPSPTRAKCKSCPYNSFCSASP